MDARDKNRANKKRVEEFLWSQAADFVGSKFKKFILVAVIAIVLSAGKALVAIDDLLGTERSPKWLRSWAAGHPEAIAIEETSAEKVHPDKVRIWVTVRPTFVMKERIKVACHFWAKHSPRNPETRPFDTIAISRPLKEGEATPEKPLKLGSNPRAPGMRPVDKVQGDTILVTGVANIELVWTCEAVTAR